MRSIAKLMKDWQFTGPNGVPTAVELPHTWNARDGRRRERLLAGLLHLLHPLCSTGVRPGTAAGMAAI